jgi:hypothetical protein
VPYDVAPPSLAAMNNTFFNTQFTEVDPGLGRFVTLHHRSSTLYQIH